MGSNIKVPKGGLLSFFSAGRAILKSSKISINVSLAFFLARTFAPENHV